MEIQHLNQIAHATAGLSETVPALAKLCEDMETHAKDQAAHARAVADMTQLLATEMELGIHALRNSSNKTTQIVEVISNIAEATRILALNASIQAARVGSAGRGFGAVADNVKKLASETTEATRSVSENLNTIQLNVDRVSTTIGISSDSHRVKTVSEPPASREFTASHSKQAAVGVAELNRYMSAIATSAEQQRENVGKLRELGSMTRSLSEDLFVTFGKFRLDFHFRAKEVCLDFSKDLVFKGQDRDAMERRMYQMLMDFPFVQLLYVTNSNGVQITSNLGRHLPDHTDASGYARNWSERHWFQNAVANRNPVISDIYRSVTSDQFCFTISIPVYEESGKLQVVIGVDIDVVKLLEEVQ